MALHLVDVASLEDLMPIAQALVWTERPGRVVAHVIEALEMCSSDALVILWAAFLEDGIPQSAEVFEVVDRDGRPGQLHNLEEGSKALVVVEGQLDHVVKVPCGLEAQSLP